MALTTQEGSADSRFIGVKMINSPDDYYLCGQNAAHASEDPITHTRLHAKFYNALALEHFEHKMTATEAFDKGYSSVKARKATS